MRSFDEIPDLNLYSSRKEELMHDLIHEFSIYSGIKVNYIKDDSVKLISRIEGDAGNSDADLLLTADVVDLHVAKEHGLLRSVNSRILNKNISSDFRDADNMWFGLTSRARVLLYREENNFAFLRDYEDMSDDRLLHKICVRSGLHPYNRSLVASVIAEHGMDYAGKWTENLVRNFARSPRGGDIDQIFAVASGECSVALINHYYFARLLDSTNEKDLEKIRNLRIIFPNQSNRGSHVNISGAGVIKYSKNYDNAVKFLEFLSVDVAQRVFAEKNHEYPVNPSVGVSEIVDSFGEYKKDFKNISNIPLHYKESSHIVNKSKWN